MAAQSRFIQIVAGVLAAVLLVLPAGTSLALCVSAEPGTHGETSGDAPLSDAAVLVAPSVHHCPGDAIDMDTAPALQSETRTAPRALNDAPVQGNAPATSPARPSSRSGDPLRAPPPPLRPAGAHISLGSTVLLV